MDNIKTVACIMWGVCRQYIRHPRCNSPDIIRKVIRLVPVEAAREFKLEEIYEAAVKAAEYMKQFEPDFYKEKAEWVRWYAATNRVGLGTAMKAWAFKDLDIRTTP